MKINRRKTKANSRTTHEDISNNETTQSRTRPSGDVTPSAGTPFSNNTRARKVAPKHKPKIDNQVALNNGFQVRSINYQESEIGSFSFNIKVLPKPLSMKTVLIGHKPPDNLGSNIVRYEMVLVDMVGHEEAPSTYDDLGKSQVFVNVEAAMLKKAMIDVKNGVVGAASTIVEALTISQ